MSETLFADISVRLKLDHAFVFFLRAVCGTGFQFRTLLFDEGIHIADEGREFLIAVHRSQHIDDIHQLPISIVGSLASLL